MIDKATQAKRWAAELVILILLVLAMCPCNG